MQKLRTRIFPQNTRKQYTFVPYPSEHRRPARSARLTKSPLSEAVLNRAFGFSQC